MNLWHINLIIVNLAINIIALFVQNIMSIHIVLSNVFVCHIVVGTYNDLGDGVLTNLNLGEVVKLDF